MSVLENANPLIVGKLKERIVTPQEEDDSVRDEIDAREIFGMSLYVSGRGSEPRKTSL